MTDGQKIFCICVAVIIGFFVLMYLGSLIFHYAKYQAMNMHARNISKNAKGEPNGR